MEKKKEKFQTHINRHYLWNYIFYIYALKSKDSTQYSGNEYDIAKKVQNGDITWFPNNTLKK